MVVTVVFIVLFKTACMKETIALIGIIFNLLACGDAGTNNAKNRRTIADSTFGAEEKSAVTGDTSNRDKEDGRNPMTGLIKRNTDKLIAIESSGDIDIDFALMMKILQEGGVEMAEEELTNGKDAEMKQVAQLMISEQKKQIRDFEEFLFGNGEKGNNREFYEESIIMLHNMEMDMNISGGTDVQFARLMIPHHKTGIQMAQAYLNKGKDPGIKTMAKAIIKEQQKEIKDLQEWLDKHSNEKA